MSKIAHCSPHYIDIFDNELYFVYIKELMIEYNLTDRVYWNFKEHYHILINGESIPVISFDAWKRDKKLEKILSY